MKKALLATLAALMTLQAGSVLAENYVVNLTRKGSNVYKIDGKDIIIHTRYCYAYAYSEEAIFKASGLYGGELIFFDSKDKCDVKAIFGLSKQTPGQYVARRSGVKMMIGTRSSELIRTSRHRHVFPLRLAKKPT